MLRGGWVVCGCEHTSRAYDTSTAALRRSVFVLVARSILVAPLTFHRLSLAPLLLFAHPRVLAPRVAMEMKRPSLVAPFLCYGLRAMYCTQLSLWSFSFFLSVTGNDLSPVRRWREEEEALPNRCIESNVALNHSRSFPSMIVNSRTEAQILAYA